MAYSQEELNNIVNSLIIDNNTNQVTPAKVRAVFDAVISSLPISVASVTATPPLYIDGFTSIFSILKADAMTNGYLSKEDWITFSEVVDISGKEDISNKTQDIEGNKTSTTFYASVKQLYDWTVAKFVRLDNIRTVNGNSLIGTTNIVTPDMDTTTAQTVSGVKTFLAGMFGLRNTANTFTSFFTNDNTASRTYTLQNRDGVIADTNNTQTFTGDQTFAGLAKFSASSATKSSFNIADGVAKTTPVNGDFWRIGIDWFFRSASYTAKNMWQDQANSALASASSRALSVDTLGMPVTNAVVGLVLNTVTLVSGVATITISGLTTSSICMSTQIIIPSGTLGIGYKAVCTANTLTITAINNTGATVTTDTTTLSYTVQI